MGLSFWILTWDDWGIGLHMVNPRLLENERGFNFFSYNADEERESMIRELTANLKYFKVIE